MYYSIYIPNNIFRGAYEIKNTRTVGVEKQNQILAI